MGQLGRPATGLPRYYMDCGWYRHPRFAGLPVEALFVFEAAVGYCTQHGTNGRMPAHPEDLAAALGIRASVVKKALTPLREREAIVDVDGQLEVRGWAEHNPTSTEVEARSQERAAAGSYGNHVRHHEKKGITSDDCDHCQRPPPPRNSDATAIADPRNSDRKPVAKSSHGMGWDGMGSTTPPVAPPAETDRTDPEPPPAATPTKRRQIPEPFFVTAAMREWAATETPGVDITAETRQFADHHRAKGSTMKDWTAAWRTWMRNAAGRFAPRVTAATRPSRSQATIDAIRARRQELAPITATGREL